MLVIQFSTRLTQERRDLLARSRRLYSRCRNTGGLIFPDRVGDGRSRDIK